ncbi:MAG TPA: acyl carrier protein [Steroidobacteraceae bacterium]|jgi:acyl carrier protein|nr:acyl carrier protein [Steroidobacteraceae bacterium]
MDPRFRDVLAEILEVDGKTLADDTRREDTETWDSLTHLRLITAVESTFHVQLSMDEIAAANTPRALEQFVRAHGGLHA